MGENRRLYEERIEAGVPGPVRFDDRCRLGSGRSEQNAPKPEKAPAPEAQPSAPSVPVDYLIGADDMLRVSVWKEPDMSVTLPVRPDGKISIPLLDDVQAAGMTPMQLAASIKEKLKKYIADPRVTVVVTAMNSQRIYVLGEVMHPGPMALLPGMTVLQALSTAGFTQFANLKAIYLAAHAKRPADQDTL